MTKKHTTIHRKYIMRNHILKITSFIILCRNTNNDDNVDVMMMMMTMKTVTII